ncbi:helix-turn-helix domain-containing protein [Falsiroseomonas frigidaquae]|nr:helix-turn-helix transcriptional regulator [Falsiroseomonas frigidaquae]
MRAADSADARLGARVRQLRRQRRLTQTDVARVLGVTYQQVQKYEAGRTRLPARMLPPLAALLQVDSASLLSGLRPASDAPKPELSEDEARDRAELLSAFAAMPHAPARRQLLAIVRAFAAETR